MYVTGPQAATKGRLHPASTSRGAGGYGEPDEWSILEASQGPTGGGVAAAENAGGLVQNVNRTQILAYGKRERNV